VLATTPVRVSEFFVDGIAADPMTGAVFVALENAIGVLDPSGTLLETIQDVQGAGQVLIT
jgi:hypothetical protein